MRKITPALAEHLSSPLTTLATCLQLTLTNQQQLGFTSGDSDLTIDGLIYHANSGFTPSALVSSNNLSIDNLEIEGILSSELITEQDILTGKYADAEILVFLVNYEDLKMGKLILHRGWLGEMNLQNMSFVAEVLGISHKCENSITKRYAPECRARFGDNCCMINLKEHSQMVTISKILSDKVIEVADLKPGYFNYGEIKFATGKAEIKYCYEKQITLIQNKARLMHIGEHLQIIAGCDKTFSTCRDIYHNSINFRGEPYIPGTHKMLKPAGQK